jgi:hypothetical protein
VVVKASEAREYVCSRTGIVEVLLPRSSHTHRVVGHTMIVTLQVFLSVGQTALAAEAESMVVFCMLEEMHSEKF